jgi:dolichyl-phosphate-mannose-protein mannosyltransferase
MSKSTRTRNLRNRTAAIPGATPPAHTSAETATARWRGTITLPRLALILLLLVSLWGRVVWLTNPNLAHIFDEVYYVNAARIIDGLHVPPGTSEHYRGSPVGLDPNQEHPPLGKAILATSMRLFGDDPYGWRLPSVAAGMLAILLLYLIIMAAGGDAWMGVLGATLFSFDNLVLVQSRIGMLDMMLVLFLLFGAWCYLRRWPLLAGIGLALATNVKITGLYGVLAILLFEGGSIALRWRETRQWNVAELKPVALLLVAFVPVWIVGLWLLDLKYSAFHNPFDHLHHIFQYGANLTRKGGPADQESYPWQWLANDVQLNYFNTCLPCSPAPQRYIVNFRGAMNPVIIGAAAFGFFYALRRAWTVQDRLSLWVVAWVVGNYLPYYPLIIVQERLGYLYYFLPILPAIAVGLAQFLRDPNQSRLLVWGYLATVLVGFIAYFPFRTVI